MKLPGEDKARARPLKPDGAKSAADDRETAEKIAFEMWEHAVQANAARQIQLESTEKIERLKAQFLDKVRHFTELVETANAKIEAEAKARAEAEAKLAQMAQAGGPRTGDGGRKTHDAGPPAMQIATQAREAESTTPPASNPQGGITSPPAPTAGPNPVARGNDRGPQQEQPAIAGVVPPPFDPRPLLETGVCECCGAAEIAMASLKRIDSGQLLCPRCLAALRADLARIESDTSA